MFSIFSLSFFWTISSLASADWACTQACTTISPKFIFYKITNTFFLTKTDGCLPVLDILDHSGAFVKLFFLRWSRSVVSDSVTPWTVAYQAYQAPPSMEFPRQEYWSGVPFPSPEDLPNPGIEPRSPALQADALLSEPPGKPFLF